MSENAPVEVGFGDNATEVAQNLLAAAERLGLDPSVVATSPLKGVFIVPEEVADEADEYAGSDESSDTGVTGSTEPKALADSSKAELDQLASDEDIDLTGAKKSNATKIERIESVRAERQAAADAAAADAASDAKDENDEAIVDNADTAPIETTGADPVPAGNTETQE